MKISELLNDPNFQTVVLPLFTTLIPVVMGWILGQIAADQKKAKWGRWLKLVVETAVLGFIGKIFPEAMAAFNSDDPTAKVIGLLYGVVLVGLLGIMVADIFQIVRKPSTLTATELDEARWQDNRQTLMDKVRVKWIDGVLNKSLYQQARIAVGLEERPEMVGVEWQTAGEEKQVLPPGTRLLDRFANLGGGGTLLVLGEPGAGKTTLLLELAQDLLEANDFRELKQPVPIVLNLSPWGTQQFPQDKTLTFTHWLLEELWQQYQVRKEVGNTWLNQEKWTLLLDGLDEVKPQHRDACVEALNQFRQQFGNIEIVLCCRIADYKELDSRLKGFQAAIYIQPLTIDQVDDYLQTGGKSLAGIAIALDKDHSLRDLTKHPLFLWILTKAYQNHSPEELLNISKEHRLTALFDRYIKQMFVQRPLPKAQQQQMQMWLSVIAQQMGAEKEFLIEHMQPHDWLGSLEIEIRRVYMLIYWLMAGLIMGVSMGLGAVFVMFSWLVGGLIGLGSILFFWLVGLGYVLNLGSFEQLGETYRIDLVEAIHFTKLLKARQEVTQLIKQKLIFDLVGGLITGLFAEINAGLIHRQFFGLISLVFGLIGCLRFGPLGLIIGLLIGLIISLIVHLFIGLTYGLFYGLGDLILELVTGLKADIVKRNHPNQGIWNSLRNSVIICNLFLLITIVLAIIVSRTLLVSSPDQGKLLSSIIIGLPCLLAFLAGGGMACINHLSLRLTLYHSKKIPWNFVTFFKQAEKRLFIYRTGGSYVFVHRYLQEHFANLSFDET